MGVHLDEVPLLQRRLGEEDPAGGSDLLRQRLSPQQVQTRRSKQTWFGSKQRSHLEVLLRPLRNNRAVVMCPGQSGLSPEPSNQELQTDRVQQVVVENTKE